MKIPENTSKNTHNVVYQLLKKDQNTNKVLDIPAGAGAFTQRLLQNNLQVFSADIEDILQVKNSNFVMADMNLTLPFDDNFFDAVVCIDGIEHLENPFFFIKECHRVVRRGGTVIISTPNINSLRSRWRWFWTSHHNKCKVPLNENEPTPLHHINMMSYQRMRYILHTKGFKIDTVLTNRSKPISFVYALFVPLAYLFTSFVYAKEEKNSQQIKNNKEIKSTLFNKSLLFGETMIVKALKA